MQWLAKHAHEAEQVAKEESTEYFDGVRDGYNEVWRKLNESITD